MADKVTWGKRPTPKVEEAPANLDDFVHGRRTKARLNFAVPDDLHARVKAGCARERVSMTDLVIEFLESRFPK